LRNFAGGEASPFVSESGKSPSHGGNTGSNPVGDARKINHLCVGIGRQAAMYGKYAEWTYLNMRERRRIAQFRGE
jgi:hypothetical protein